jgi:hypothetical protein
VPGGVGPGDAEHGDGLDAERVDQLPGVMGRDRVPGGVRMETPVLVEQDALGAFEDGRPKFWESSVKSHFWRERLLQIAGDGLGVQVPDAELLQSRLADPVDEVLQLQEDSLALEFKLVPENVWLPQV